MFTDLIILNCRVRLEFPLQIEAQGPSHTTHYYPSNQIMSVILRLMQRFILLDNRPSIVTANQERAIKPSMADDSVSVTGWWFQDGGGRRRPGPGR